jgi:hypothetical protein
VTSTEFKSVISEIFDSINGFKSTLEAQKSISESQIQKTEKNARLTLNTLQKKLSRFEEFSKKEFFRIDESVKGFEKISEKLKCAE